MQTAISEFSTGLLGDRPLECYKWPTIRPMPNLTVACMEDFRPQQCLHRVSSCHTDEVISIRTFTCSTPCPKWIFDFSRGWWNPYQIWRERIYSPAYPQTDAIVLDFSISLAFSHCGIVGLKVSTLDPQIGENWVFRPQFWGRGRMRIPL